MGLYVLQKAQGQGIGTSLMQAALEALREKGCSQAALWVLDSNTHAIAYYARRGFQDTGLTQGSGPVLERQMLCSLLAPHGKARRWTLVLPRFLFQFNIHTPRLRYPAKVSQAR